MIADYLWQPACYGSYNIGTWMIISYVTKENHITRAVKIKKYCEKIWGIFNSMRLCLNKAKVYSGNPPAKPT